MCSRRMPTQMESETKTKRPRGVIGLAIFIVACVCCGVGIWAGVLSESCKPFLWTLELTLYLTSLGILSTLGLWILERSQPQIADRHWDWFILLFSFSLLIGSPAIVSIYKDIPEPSCVVNLPGVDPSVHPTPLMKPVDAGDREAGVFHDRHTVAAVEALLVLCGSLTNLLAIFNIARQEKLETDRTVGIVLTVQIFFLSAFIGWSMLEVLPFEGPRLAVSLGITFGTPLALVIMKASTEKFRAGLQAALFMVVAMMVFPHLFLATQQFVARNFQHFAGGQLAGFLGARLHAYSHLVCVPALYLLVDVLLRRKIPDARKSLSLDFVLVVTGVSLMLAGIAAYRLGSAEDFPLFEAGASAAVLLLGNAMWLLGQLPASNTSRSSMG